jgi:hypothetical protein
VRVQRPPAHTCARLSPLRARSRSAPARASSSSAPRAPARPRCCAPSRGSGRWAPRAAGAVPFALPRARAAPPSPLTLRAQPPCVQALAWTRCPASLLLPRQAGSGSIFSHGLPGLGDPGCQPGSVLFLPQKPYMILGSLRDQVGPLGGVRRQAARLTRLLPFHCHHLQDLSVALLLPCRRLTPASAPAPAPAPALAAVPHMERARRQQRQRERQRRVRRQRQRGAAARRRRARGGAAAGAAGVPARPLPRGGQGGAGELERRRRCCRGGGGARGRRQRRGGRRRRRAAAAVGRRHQRRRGEQQPAGLRRGLGTAAVAWGAAAARVRAAAADGAAAGARGRGHQRAGHHQRGPAVQGAGWGGGGLHRGRARFPLHPPRLRVTHAPPPRPAPPLLPPNLPPPPRPSWTRA